MKLASRTVFLLFIALSATSQGSKEFFQDAIEGALKARTQQQRIHMLSRLFYFEGVSSEIRNQYAQQTIKEMAKHKNGKVTFEPLPEGHQENFEQGGVSYYANAPHEGFAVIDGETKVPYGRVNGRFVFPAVSRTQTRTHADKPSVMNSKEKFKLAIEEALAAEGLDTRVTKLTRLFDFEGADAGVREIYVDRTIPRIAELKNGKVTFAELKPDHKQGYVLDGVEYEANIDHIGYVVIDGNTNMPYGKKGGDYLFPTLRAKVVDPEAKDVQLQVIVTVSEEGGPGKFKGHCMYTQSNDESARQEIEDTGVGNRTVAWWGKSLDSCEVTLLSEKARVKMIVQNGNDQEKTLEKELQKNETLSWP